MAPYGRVLGEDPNMGKQAAKAAYESQEPRGCCATRNTHEVHCLKNWEEARCEAVTRLTVSTQKFRKRMGIGPTTRNHFPDSFK